MTSAIVVAGRDCNGKDCASAEASCLSAALGRFGSTSVGFGANSRWGIIGAMVAKLD